MQTRTTTTSRYEWLIFDGALGYGALAWGPRGLARVTFAEPNEVRLRNRMVKALGANAERPAPRDLRGLVSRLRRHLAGTPQLFDDVRLDLTDVSPFARQIYQALRAVPVGETVTYAELGSRAGHGHAARAVGGAVARNPVPLVVPCHRVIAAGGKAGGFSAPGGVVTKARLLAIEGVTLPTV